MTREYTSYDFWRFAVGINPIHLLLGVNYWRLVEHPLAANWVASDGNCAILDLGSGPLGAFPLFLAWQRRYRVYATDINPDYVRRYRAILGEHGQSHLLSDGYLSLCVEDARALAFDDGAFDSVAAISTVEHIPGLGDVHAMQEIARVLKTEGRAFVSVPFSTEYAEEWVPRESALLAYFDPRARIRKLAPASPTRSRRQFYQRRYDPTTIRERLIAPSGLAVERTIYLDELYPISSTWQRLPLPVRVLLRWLMPIMSKAIVLSTDPCSERTRAACLVLAKTTHVA